MSATNQNKSTLKTLFHGIGNYILRNIIVANVQEV